MGTSVQRVLGINELLEHIILQLDSIRDIIRAQRVCRSWRDAIHASPAILEACWFRPQPHRRENEREGSLEQPAAPDQQTWKLNPVFNHLGVTVKTMPGKTQEGGEFSLERRVYDKQGSWTAMLATQPPCRLVEVNCFGDDSADETMSYIIESTTGCLLLGDIMAVLAEGQNRQECGIDRWAALRHFSGVLLPVTEQSCSDIDLLPILADMPDDVSINVAVALAWGSGNFPAFSLRGLYPPLPHPGPGGCTASSSRHFLRELIVHRMVYNGYEYEWEGWWHGGERWIKVCKEREYEANLLVVREHSEGYLAECSHIFRLISDVL